MQYKRYSICMIGIIVVVTRVYICNNNSYKDVTTLVGNLIKVIFIIANNDSSNLSLG
jgi:hypothetical protein